MEIDNIEKLTREKKRWKRKNDFKKLAETCSLLGVLLTEKGKLDDSLSEHKEALELYHCINDHEGEMVSHRYLGECFSTMGMYNEALKEHEIYMKLAINSNSLIEQQRAFVSLGNDHLAQVATYRNSKITKSCLKNAKESFILAQNFCEKLRSSLEGQEFSQMRSRCFYNLGLVDEYKREDDKALINYQQAIKISQEDQLFEDLCMYLHTYASFAYKKLKKIDLSFSLCNQLTKISTKIKNYKYMCLASSLRIDIFIHRSDFSSAKRELVILYKIKKDLKCDDKKNEEKKIERKLKRVIKILNLIEEIDLSKKCSKSSKTPFRQNDAKVLYKLYEKLGDSAVKMKNFEFALKSYKNMEVCAKQLNMQNLEMRDVITSIWMTLKDLGLYSECISYLNKEINIFRDNPLKISDLLLKRTMIMIKAKYDNFSIKSSFEETLQATEGMGEQTFNFKKDILKKQLRWQKFEGINSYEIEQTNQKLNSLNCATKNSENEIEEESESNEENLFTDYDDDLDDTDDLEEDEVDLDREMDLCSDNDEMENDDLKGKKFNKKNPFLKLNKYGETILQTACISGDLKKVASYISKGCPINTRDHSGWLPIHDAANQGHADIVKLLIESGSLVDDRGGKDCGGFTPMHSACANGHVDVVEIFLKKGFTELLMRKSDEQELPVNLFREFIESNKDENGKVTEYQKEFLAKMIQLTEAQLSSDTLGFKSKFIDTTTINNNNNIKNKQSTFVTSANSSFYSYSKKNKVKKCPIFNKNRLCDLSLKLKIKEKSDENIIEEYEEEKDEGFEVRTETRTDNDEYEDARRLLNPKTAALVYRETITNLRKPPLSVFRQKNKTIINNSDNEDNSDHKVLKIKSKISPLIYESDLVLDDWLVDDNKNASINDNSNKKGSSSSFICIKHNQKNKKINFNQTDEINNNSFDYYQNNNINIDKTFKKNQINESDGENEFSLFNYQKYNTNIDNCIKNNNKISISKKRFLDNDSMNLKKRKIGYETKKNENEDNYLEIINNSDNGNNENNNRNIDSKYSEDYYTGHGENNKREPIFVNNNDRKQNSNSCQQKWFKVKIEDKLIFIPFNSKDEEDKNIEWLCKEVSERYYKSFSSKPKICLWVSMGDTLVRLFQEDPLLGAFHPKELYATITDWQEVSMENKYNDACSLFSTTAYTNIKKQLLETEVTGVLNLNFKKVQYQQIQPLFHSLQSLSSFIKEAHFQGNNMNDQVLSLFVPSLPLFPLLSTLDLSLNFFTHLSLKRLSALVEREKCLQSLSWLILDKNNLSDLSANFIFSLIKNLPLLKRLQLASCHLTERFFQNSNSSFLKESCIEHLDLSDNLLNGCFGGPFSFSLINLFNLSKLITLKITTSESEAKFQIKDSLSKLKKDVKLRNLFINNEIQN